MDKHAGIALIIVGIFFGTVAGLACMDITGRPWASIAVALVVGFWTMMKAMERMGK